jgi:carboxypeptidase Taq
MDVSIHPFSTSIGYDDVRITTNFGREQPLFAFFSTMHEAGHALYDQGFPKGKFKDTVISDAPSLGLHESQSRFWENMIGHSKAFWSYFYPVFQKTFQGQLKNIDFNTWYSYVNQVKPSLIRIEADELTYCLHVILRFEIEMDLIDGKIKVSELPKVWNEKMGESLGLVPKTDKDGVLQDMHWSGGDFGYFPTYAIGTIYASQLFKKLSEEKPTIFDEIEKGNFANILGWLREHVHKYGRLMSADEIIKNTCGEGLNSRVFVDYLKGKYFELYEL